MPGQVLVTFALGSCIGLTAYDPVSAVGGLLHFMLPDSTIDPERARVNPCMFADTGIPLLLDRVCKHGGAKRRLAVHAVGGAQMLDQQGVFEIGKRNYLAMRKALWKAGSLLHGEAVGGGNRARCDSRSAPDACGSSKAAIKRSWLRRFHAREEIMSYRVLIVDDSPAMRAFVKRVIELSGFDLAACFEAGNGREALSQLRGEWVDAILTDINMPGMDGEELLQALASDDLLHSIPTLVISTDATEKRIGRLMSLGAKGYITKPFRPEDLREGLERVLGDPNA